MSTCIFLRNYISIANKLCRHKNVHTTLQFVQTLQKCNLSQLSNQKITLPTNSSLEKHINKLRNEYCLIKNNTNCVASAQRIKELKPLIDIINKRTKLLENINNLKELLNEKDEELKALAEEEKQVCISDIKQTEDTFINTLVSLNTSNDDCNSIVLEISAGVGGQEAMLFANELFDMYCNFAEYKGWDCYVADFDKSDMGGIRHASAFMDGRDVYDYFRYEAGVHRVQRIPSTEKAGRVHTSTVSVNALPQPNDFEITIKDKDLKIETKRASGAGGQHVNTTDSAVRIVHLPTGVAVECQTDRSQIKNRKTAMQKLKAKLYQQQLDAQLAETAATKKGQVRSNYRNEKIRTYNFSQDRITDHRLQSMNFHNLKLFLIGGEPLDTLINKLRDADKEKILNDLLNS